MQNTNVFAIGVKYFPSIPLSVSIGKNTIRMMNTANVAERTTPEAPFSTSSSISVPDKVRPFSLLLYRWASMPSTITMEPSTTIPKSIAPRLIRLAVTPKIRIRMNANSIASGMTEATISPARMLPKKMISTTNTIIAPSIRLCTTVEIFRFTNSERFRYGSMLTPSGNSFCIFSTRFSSSCVTTLALAPFNIMAIPPTHSPFPSLVIAPKRLGAPKRTMPTSLMCTGMPLRLATTICSISLVRLIMPSERM